MGFCFPAAHHEHAALSLCHVLALAGRRNRDLGGSGAGANRHLERRQRFAFERARIEYRCQRRQPVDHDLRGPQLRRHRDHEFRHRQLVRRHPSIRPRWLVHQQWHLQRLGVQQPQQQFRWVSCQVRQRRHLQQDRRRQYDDQPELQQLGHRQYRRRHDVPEWRRCRHRRLVRLVLRRRALHLERQLHPRLR